MAKFKVELSADNYNRMSFEFERLELAQNFINIVLHAVDKEKTTGMHATITYIEKFEEENKEDK